jgi:integrase
LRWPDVNLDQGVITVRNALQRQTGKGLVLAPPKSDSSRRSIELPAVCVEALKAHWERQQAARTWAGSAWKETGHVFTSSIGTPIDDRRILREFTTLVEAAKLPRQRFHDLRHACISLLAAQGVPLKVIAEIVGHSDIRLTQNVYQHVFQPAKRAAADKMNDVLTGFATSFATRTTPKEIN